MNNLAIIPARSGSKGLKDKNIKNMNGKPLIAYTIEAAIESGEFSEVMVSTDSEKYAVIARQYGAQVPFLRSAENATDGAGTWEAVREVLNGYKQSEKQFDTFCILQPTSPLRTAGDIRKAYDLYREKAELAVVSVCEAEHSPLWCGHLGEDDSLDGFLSAENMQQRQKYGRFYRPNGAIYIVNISRFSEGDHIYQTGSYAYVMDAVRSYDIDTELDFKIAEMLMKEGNYAAT